MTKYLDADMVDVTFQKLNGKCSINFVSEFGRKGFFFFFWIGTYLDSQKYEDYFSYYYSQDLPW